MTVSIELKSSGHYTSLRDAETLIRESGKLFLHPISETHQFRPTLTYMDALTRKSRRRGGGFSDDESDGPPPDPDEPAPPPAAKKDKKPSEDAKEVQVAVRKSGDDRGMGFGGGLTAVRREMLTAIRAEEDERWENYDYHDREVSFTLYVYTFSSRIITRTRTLVRRLTPCFLSPRTHSIALRPLLQCCQISRAYETSILRNV